MRTSLCFAVGLLALSTAFAQDAATEKKEKALLANAEKFYRQSKAAFLKKPKDAKVKKSYIDSTVSFGTITMNSPLLSPKDKYPKALNLYREALKIDPKNAVALNNKKMIEDIYKSMGRKVPG
jgi:tetratricopeptide (TPR) repeat protein